MPRSRKMQHPIEIEMRHKAQLAIGPGYRDRIRNEVILSLSPSSAAAKMDTSVVPRSKPQARKRNVDFVMVSLREDQQPSSAVTELPGRAATAYPGPMPDPPGMRSRHCDSELFPVREEDARTTLAAHITAPTRTPLPKTSVPNIINKPNPTGFPSAGPNTAYKKIGATHRPSKMAETVVIHLPSLTIRTPNDRTPNRGRTADGRNHLRSLTGESFRKSAK